MHHQCSLRQQILTVIVVFVLYTCAFPSIAPGEDSPAIAITRSDSGNTFQKAADSFIIRGTTLPVTLPEGFTPVEPVTEDKPPEHDDGTKTDHPATIHNAQVLLKVVGTNGNSQFTISRIPIRKDQDAKITIDELVKSIDKITTKEDPHRKRGAITRNYVHGDPICGLIYDTDTDADQTKLVYIIRHFRDDLIIIRGTCENAVYRRAVNEFLHVGESIGTVTIKNMKARAHSLALRLEEDPFNDTLKGKLALIHVEMAHILYCGDRFEEATSFLFESAKLTPDNPDILERLADSFLFFPSPLSGHCAANYYEEALALNPENMKLRIKFATTLGATGEYFDAMEQFETITRNNENTPNGDYLTELSVIYAKLGKNDHGISFFSEMEKAGGDQRFTIARAILCRGTGKLSEAKNLLSDIIAKSTAPPHIISYARSLLKHYEKSKYGRID